jgi:hypothetical protein
VVGDVDPHLGADLGLACRVGGGEGGGDVLQAGDAGLDARSTPWSNDRSGGLASALGHETELAVCLSVAEIEVKAS